MCTQCAGTWIILPVAKFKRNQAIHLLNLNLNITNAYRDESPKYLKSSSSSRIIERYPELFINFSRILSQTWRNPEYQNQQRHGPTKTLHKKNELEFIKDCKEIFAL